MIVKLVIFIFSPDLQQLKVNPTLNNFFQRMSYSSFQKLADAYLEKEASPIHNPPTVLPTAPELVKLAFTYDFTAKIVRLSKQNMYHITGLGNRYLQERFEYKQVGITTVHILFQMHFIKMMYIWVLHLWH